MPGFVYVQCAAMCGGYRALCPATYEQRTVANRVSANGLRIGDGGAFEKRQPTFVQMPNRITNVEFRTVSPTIANTMLMVRALFLVYFAFLLSIFLCQNENI